MSKKLVAHARPSESFWVRNKKSEGYLLRKTSGNIAYKIVRALLLFGLCFMIVQPLLTKLSVSFMTENDLYDSTVINIPRHLTADNYVTATVPDLLNYGPAFLNTLTISLFVSILQVASATLVGYGFARFKFPLKNFWFFCVILTVIIPPQTISTALHLNFSYFNPFGIVGLFNGGNSISLLHGDNYIKLGALRMSVPYLAMSATCQGLKNGLYIYMIRQFFQGVPVSLEEAAYVDGCPTFKTFWRGILPDAIPILVSCFLFAFVWQWTDTFYSLKFIGDASSIPLLSTKLSGFNESVIQWNAARLGLGPDASNDPGPGLTQQMISTGTLVVVAPLLLLYLLAQKGFVESIANTGLK